MITYFISGRAEVILAATHHGTLTVGQTAAGGCVYSMTGE